MRAKLISYRNETLSICAMARKYDKPASTVWNRLSQGHSVEYALFGYPQGQGRVTINGVTRSIDGWSRIAKITAFSFYRRRRLYPNEPERWITPDTRRKGITAFKRTQSAREWEAETGINERTIWRRIAVTGLTPEQALTMPVDMRYSRRKK